MVGRAPPGSIVMYATSANSTASDGTGRNGLFTTQLLNNLKTPGLSVLETFTKTGNDVIVASGQRQHPEISIKYFDTAYLGTRPAPPPTPAVTPTPAPTPNPRPATGNMVWVEGGTFMMGSNTGDSDEMPVHQVTVKGFYISKYQVTQAEWTAVMGTNPSNFKGDTLPVEMVSWLEAIEFCNRLSQKEGLTPCYRGSGNNIICNWNANGYRLPTEAEWEYAANGGSNVHATTYSGSNSIDAVAWYDKNSKNKTNPVGMKSANTLGLYDMSGNVWEWCWDWYGSYNSGAQTDPKGASLGSSRVVRGGSWQYSAWNVRSANRYFFLPSYHGSNVGLRIVRNDG